jgi:hypothetical protein
MAAAPRPPASTVDPRGDQYDDQGRLIVNVVPNPDMPDRPGDLTPEQSPAQRRLHSIQRYRQQRERANASIPMESGPAREAAANPPVPRAWVDGGAGLEVLIENRPDGVFVTGSRTAGGGEAQMWGSELLPVESGFILPDSVFATPDDQIPTLNMSDMQQTQTGPDTMTQVMGDVQQGIGETLTGQTLEYGARQAVSGALALASDARDALTSLIPDDVRQTLGIAESVRLEDWVPDMAPPESVTGNIVSALSQFLIPYGAVMKGVSVAGKAATTIGGRSGQAMLGGAAVDFTVWDTQDERFADLVQTIPWAANDITAWLASNEDDSVLEVRLKNSIEGALLGGLVDSIVSAARIYRAGKQMVEGLGPDVMDKLREFGANTDGTVNIPDGMMPPSLRGADAPAAGDAATTLPDAAGRDAGAVPSIEPPTSLQDADLTPPAASAARPDLVAENQKLRQDLGRYVATAPKARDTVHSLAPHLRMTVDLPPGTKLPPAVQAKVTQGNGAQVFSRLDAALDLTRGETLTEETWGRTMAPVYGSAEVPIPPRRLIAMVENPTGTVVADLKGLSDHQLGNVNTGLGGANVLGGRYAAGDVTVEDTTKLFLWSFLSRGVDPFTQESLFLDAMTTDLRAAAWQTNVETSIEPFVRLALQGDFDADAALRYREWSEGVAGKGEGLAGAGASHNLNAFGDFLLKMGERGADGKSHLQAVHDMIAEGVPSREIRRAFHRRVSGVGIDNKVLSFTLLAAGRTDVVILDRVMISALFNDGRFAGINLYDGVKAKALTGSGKASTISGTSFAGTTTGARGLAMYEMIEDAITEMLPELSAALGREMTLGRFHWENWVRRSDQEVDHATLDAILEGVERRKSGQSTGDLFDGIYVRQGAHDTYNYGLRAGVDMNGARHYLYPTSDGLEYVLTPRGWQTLVGEIKKPKNGVVPKGFKVSEHTNKPWLLDPVVNREKLDALIQKYGEPFRRGHNGQPVNGGTAGADLRSGTSGNAGGGGLRGAAIVGGSGAAALVGGAGQDALASTGDQYDDQGNLIVNVVPNPDVPTRPGDLTPTQAAGPETQVAGAASEAMDALARALNGNVEARAVGVLGKAIDDSTFRDLRSAMDTPAMDDVAVALGEFNYAALTTTGQIDDLFAAVTERFATGIDNMVGSQPRQALTEMQTTLANMQQQLDQLKALPPEAQTLDQAQRDIAQIELVAQIRDLEQRIERGRAAEGGVMTDDTVAWMADATGLNAERLINRQTGEAYNAAQLRAARAIVTGALDDLRALHAEALVSQSPDDIALLRRTATITAALLLQYKGATAEAGRALGSLRGNAAMPPGMNASTIPDTPMMQTFLLRDYFEASGGMAINKRFLDMMTEALKEPNEALLANFVRKAKGASTMDMLAEAWINSLLGSPTTHMVNFASNTALTGAMLAERWAGSLGHYGGTGQASSPASAMAYTLALTMAIPDALKLALRSTVSSHYSSKFTTSTREAAITAENIRNLATRQSGQPISDTIDRTVGTALQVAGKVLPRRILETGGPLATVVDFLAEYYYRAPGRLLGGADEFFKVINYRAALAEFAYMQAMSEGLTGQAFKDRMTDIIRNPETQAPDIHLASIDHSRYATLQMEPTPMMVAMGRLRSTIPGGRIIVPFLNIIGNITRVAYHRAPGVGMLTGDNMRRLQSGTAADRQVVAGRQIMGLSLLAAGGTMAAAGYLTGRLTDDYSKEQALEAGGVPPRSLNIGALMGGKDRWISVDRLEPITMLLLIAADTAQVLAYTDSEDDASAIVMAAGLAVEQYMLDQSFLQGVSDLFAVADPRMQTGEASVDALAGYLANLLATAPGALLGPLAPGTPLSGNLARNFDDVRRSARPDPNQTLAYRMWEQTLNRIRSRTPGLGDAVEWAGWDALPPRYNWLGKELRYEAAGPDLISPLRYLEGDYDSRPLIDMGIDPGRARILDLTGMQIGFEGEPSTDIPRDRWAEFIKAVGIEGEMIRLGITPTLPPRKIAGIELTPTQDSIYAYLRGQGVKIRGDGNYMTAQAPNGDPIPLKIPLTAVGERLYVGLDPSRFYTMEEMLEAVIATPEYRDNLSDYSEGAGARGMDQKAELISEIMGIYTSDAPNGSALFGARLALFTVYPDLARDVFARRFNLDPANVNLPQAQQFLGMQP